MGKNKEGLGRRMEITWALGCVGHLWVAGPVDASRYVNLHIARPLADRRRLLADI
jgi:hypothetical protein